MTRIGLVGIGKWGENWLRTLATLPEISLRWCCDLNEKLLAKARLQYPQVTTTTSFDDLLRDPATEGVVIASIAPTHYALAKEAIEAGKHVLVEKPMTLTSAEALELIRLADRSRRVLMVGHLMEYHSAIPAIRKLIDDGEIGEVQRIECRRSNHGILRVDENVWWSFAPHDISIALRLMGDWPTAVKCEGQCIIQRHVADVVSGTLTFPGERVARIDVSWHDPIKVRELKVYGSKKWVVFNDMLPWDRKLTVHDRGFDVSPSAIPQQRITMRQGESKAIVLDTTEPLVIEARHFAECIRCNTRPLSDGISGAGVVSVLEFGQESLDTGREIPIPKPDSCVRARKAA
jgi:predicted dehydrogenase